MLRVRVLGALGVEVDGRQVDVPHGRSRQLIAYLALHPGLHPRGQVAGHLWPDSDSELARQRLRTTMWEVRRALSDVAEPLVDASREDLGLHSAVIVDLVEAHSLLQAGATEAALELLTPGVAVELDQEWADEARREADAWRLRALEAAMREAVDIGAALSYARRRVALDPLSEGAHRDLIGLLAESGDRAAAMAAYEQMRQVLESELGIGPSAVSRRVLADLSSENTPGVAAVARARRRVPVATTPLVGRDAELIELREAVRVNRLVSVVGPGGVGKSRITFAVAGQEEDRGHSVAVAELATTPRGDACDYVVAAALGVHAGPGRAIRDAIVDRLELEPGLLVLDNCEHVLVPVREFVTHLLRWSVGARVLVTSREPLALPGEHVVRLLPLPVPTEGDNEQQILASPAVQLLSNAARGRSWQATPETLHASELARLARRLDGLPLALELAAARIPSLGVAVLADRLTAGLDVLSAGHAATGSRHDSLVATVEWSLTMLSPHEHALLGLLSLMPGPFPITAVEAVVHAAGLTTDPVVGLARLVEASLIQVHPDEVWCYSVLETIRVFGSRLLNTATADSARRGLVSWAVRFADDVRRREFTAEERVHAEMMRFLPLVRAALHEAREHGDIDAQRHIIKGVEGWGTWREQPEVWAWVSELAALEPQEHADPHVLLLGVVAAWRVGRTQLMRTFTERCVAADPSGPAGATTAAAMMLVAFAERRWADVVELAEPVHADQAINHAPTMTLVATALVRLGRPAAALEVARTARRDAESLGAPSHRALALLAEARACSAADPTMLADGRSDTMLAEARRLADSVGSADLAASIDKERGLQALRRGLPERAVEPLREACLHWLTTGNAPPLTKAIDGLAEALAKTGQPDVAARLQEAAQTGELTAPQLATMITLEDTPTHA